MPQILSDYYPPEYEVQLLTAPIAVPMHNKLGTIVFKKLIKTPLSMMLVH